jgi:hypothetical protein
VAAAISAEVAKGRVATTVPSAGEMMSKVVMC